MAELQGDGLTMAHIEGLETAFIASINDSQRAGRLLADALSGVSLEWPRFRAHLKREGLDYGKDYSRALGRAVCSRVSMLAYNEFRCEQLLEPAYRALRPRWKFICSMDMSPPKACLKFHGAVLPVEDALKVFPKLPCKLLQCSCRIAAQDRLPKENGSSSEP